MFARLARSTIASRSRSGVFPTSTVMKRYCARRFSSIPLINSGILIGFCRVVLFEHEIGAGLFEKYFDQVGAFPVVINNQDTSLFFDHGPDDSIDLRLIESINATQRWISD